MTEVVDPDVVRYAEEHSTALPDYLTAIEARTRSDFPMWGMMVGRQEGRFLELMVFAARATRILEIGTFTGFSSIAMAAGLGAEGKIDTCEVDPHHAATARENIAASPYADRITVHEGPALETVHRLPGPFDLVFIDADKTGYDAYFEAVLPKLSGHGVILADNTLFHGEVLSEKSSDPSALALREFNDKVASDPRVVCSLTTIRDGVTVIRPVIGLRTGVRSSAPD